MRLPFMHLYNHILHCAFYCICICFTHLYVIYSISNEWCRESCANYFITALLGPGSPQLVVQDPTSVFLLITASRSLEIHWLIIWHRLNCHFSQKELFRFLGYAHDSDITDVTVSPAGSANQKVLITGSRSMPRRRLMIPFRASRSIDGWFCQS